MGNSPLQENHDAGHVVQEATRSLVLLVKSAMQFVDGRSLNARIKMEVKERSVTEMLIH